VQNFKDLVKINRSSSVINCIDGLKVLSAFWNVVGNRKRFNSIKPKTTVEKFVMTIIQSHQLAQTIFIVCSGILVTQSFLKAIERNQLNTLKQIINRFFRFISTVAIVMLFSTSSLFENDESPARKVESRAQLISQTALVVQNFNTPPLVSSFKFLLSVNVANLLQRISFLWLLRSLCCC
jgi:peptidoglycan/LPS O-acetylase OafA/YrhL